MGRYSPLLTLWLFVVWLMLWSSVDPLVLVTGVVATAAVLLVFPLHPVRSPLFARPHRFLALGGYLVWDLVSSGVRIGWDAARSGPRAKAVIVEAPILLDRDFILASAANMLSLSPGQFVLHIDRPRGRFYVYALGVDANAPATEVVEQIRQGAVDIQLRVAKVFGTTEEIRTAVVRAREIEPCAAAAGSPQQDPPTPPTPSMSREQE